MYCFSAKIKKIVAGFLLGLLVFILAEKNVHAHDGYPYVHQQGESPVLHTGFSCFICEYQLSGDADAPLVFAVSSFEYLSHTFTTLLKQQYCDRSIPGTGERGPPFFC